LPIWVENANVFIIMSQTEEENAYHELIAKLAAGDDTAAAALLDREFSGDSVCTPSNPGQCAVTERRG
jgi:hypothetical protein